MIKTVIDQVDEAHVYAVFLKELRGALNLKEQAQSTIQNFRIVQKEGNRDVARDIEHYNHNVVIYIGYRAQATSATIRFQRFIESVFQKHMEAEHARAKCGHWTAQKAVILEGRIFVYLQPLWIGRPLVSEGMRGEK